MKLTKEDYMRLPKERLAELLAELDLEIYAEPYQAPENPSPYYPSWPVWCKTGGEN